MVLVSLSGAQVLPALAQTLSTEPVTSTISSPINLPLSTSTIPVDTSSTIFSVPTTTTTTSPVSTSTTEMTSSSLDVQPQDPPTISEFEKSVSKSTETPLHYSRLMRQTQESKQEGSVVSQKQVAADIAQFVKTEKQKLDDLGIDVKKQKKYFQRLHTQARLLDESQSTVFEKIKDFLQDILPFKKSSGSLPNTQNIESQEKIPVTPPSFHFQDDVIPVVPLENATVRVSSAQKIEEQLKQFLKVAEVSAMDDQFLPVVQDVQGSVDVPVDMNFKEIATALHNNPVEIMNYVKNTITYEPYFGFKKGAAGCLQQKVCNDVDSAALTVSLLRSAGIPAHFKKSLAVFAVSDLQNLLGVEDIKSVYASFALSKVPVFTVTVPIPAGVNLDAVDLSAETHLAVQWVVPEVFYEYDERGANIDNDLSFETTTSTEALRATLSDFPKKQWVPVDVVIKPYIHQKRDILTDRINFNTQNFWNSYLTYQGNLTPLEKFRSDVQNLSGVISTSSLSVVLPQEKKFALLPLSLPFVFASGVGAETPINEETWSILPDSYKAYMRLSVLTQNGQVVLENNFLGSEIDNQEITLGYDGATPADKALLTQYGGIGATPAELVDIVPYFQTKNGRVYNNNPVSINIGDTLTLRFEMTLGGQTIQRDEKYAVAGNIEGIYMIFSALETKPEYDTTAKVLAGGNAALAYKYLEHIESERKFLQNFYDVASNIHFARAVVTQNRILNTVNNIPTTFEFKGLTIDAGVYLAADVSRRGGYTTHRFDTRLLFGLDASFYEGRLFEDIAGLTGISTVKGFQYAAANAATYTVSRITLANEASIDALPFSLATKQNMHTAVRSGNTIITPSRAIQMGSWQGILYINLSPSGTGQYAIGEQTVQNGGWTISTMLRRIYQNAGQQEREGFLANFGTYNFYYEENDSYDTVLCRITNAEYNLVVSRPDWRAEYGYPCFLDNKQFGATQHSYIVTSNGAYFFSPGQYDYWVSRDNVKGVLLTDKNGEVSEGLQNVRLDGEFKFNPIAGTYSWFGHFDGPAEDFNLFAGCRNCITAYYQPMLNRVGHGRMVYGSILQKLSEPHYNVGSISCNLYDQYCEKRNWVLNLLGFPLMNRAPAATSTAKSSGDYQAFVGGHVYRKNYWGMSKTSYVPEVIHTFYNNQNQCRIINNGQPICGSGGLFGFPNSDPKLVGNLFVQSFEEADILYNTQTRVASIQNQSEKSRRFQNKEFARNIFYRTIGQTSEGQDISLRQRLTDVEAFAIIADYIARRRGITNDDFVQDITVLFTGSEGMIKYSINDFISDGIDKTYYIGGFSDNGFKFIYNDSHYCVDKKQKCISNQISHSMLGFNAAYFWSKNFADDRTYSHDSDPSPLACNKDKCGTSKEDINLGLKMAEFGDALRRGVFTKEYFSIWILNNISIDPNISSNDFDHLRTKNIDEVTLSAQYKKPFRIFEYEQNGNTYGKWSYSKNFEFVTCNGKEVYMQDYDFFLVNGVNPERLLAVWDSDSQRIIVLIGDSYKQYINNKQNICRDFEILTNNFSQPLHQTFMEMVTKIYPDFNKK